MVRAPRASEPNPNDAWWFGFKRAQQPACSDIHALSWGSVFDLHHWFRRALRGNGRAEDLSRAHAYAHVYVSVEITWKTLKNVLDYISGHFRAYFVTSERVGC